MYSFKLSLISIFNRLTRVQTLNRFMYWELSDSDLYVMKEDDIKVNDMGT